MRLLFWLILCTLPWCIRRRVLVRFFKWDIDPAAKISKSLVMCQSVKMAAGAVIHGKTIVNGLSRLEMGAYSELGAGSRVFSEPLGSEAFPHEGSRNPTLIIGEETAVLGARIDCQDKVEIGAFTTLAGRETLILTHQIDMAKARMMVAPAEIGSYCMVGARATILPGAKLPDYCALGAGAVLTKPFSAPYTLYAGVPAQHIKSLENTTEYFRREKGKLQ